MTGSLSRLLPVLLLVVAQTSLLLHELDFARHAGSDVCTICLGAHSLGGALPADGMALPALAVTAESPAPPLLLRPTSRTPLRLVARSPPFALSA